MESTPSAGTLVGTFALVVGVLWLIATRDHTFGEDDLYGGLLVVGGLLIRIESAVRREARRPADAAPGGSPAA